MADPTSFHSLNLKAALLSSLSDIGYHEMTPVQAHTLPRLLDGADVLARARTGSGKTAAFGLGLLNKLDVASYRVQALVLCPTRELADQVAGEIRRLARSIPNVKVQSLCGGVPLTSAADLIATFSAHHRRYARACVEASKNGGHRFAGSANAGAGRR